MENSRLRAAAPTSVNVTVGKRGREYLTDREVERLIEAAKQNRSGHRDATAILVRPHGSETLSFASIPSSTPRHSVRAFRIRRTVPTWSKAFSRRGSIRSGFSLTSAISR